MRHFVTLFIPLLVATSFVGCGSDNPTNIPTQPTPVEVTISFSDTLNVNGARTHPFDVERAGTVTAQVRALSDSAATLGINLGTFNGSSCAIIIAKSDAVLNTTIVGTAQTAGSFCLWVNDVGKLTAGIDYTIDVTHF